MGASTSTLSVCGLIADDVVLAQFEVDRRAFRGHEGCRGPGQRLYARELHRAADSCRRPRRASVHRARIAWRCTVRRDVAAARAGAAPLEQVIGEKPHVRANALGIDSLHRRRDRAREARAASPGLDPPTRPASTPPQSRRRTSPWRGRPSGTISLPHLRFRRVGRRCVTYRPCN